MSFVGRVSPTRGALVRLRTSLTFIKNALAILKLKRDRLAEELNLLLKEMSRREKAEHRLSEIYEDFKVSLAMLGASKMRSAADSVGEIKVDVKERSIMNVMVPEIRIVEKPSAAVLQDASLYQIAEKMNAQIDEWFEIARVETSIERIANELMLVNRKINAIEKVVVPSYESQVKYIEDFLADEELEDFTRIKHVKAASREETA